MRITLFKHFLLFNQDFFCVSKKLKEDANLLYFSFLKNSSIAMRKCICFILRMLLQTKRALPVKSLRACCFVDTSAAQ